MSPTVERLLASLEPLPHSARLAHLARTARDLARKGELPAVLAELDSRGTYERRLAALAALAGRHADHLTARLTDPDPVVRGYALHAVHVLALPDAAVEAAWDDASEAARRGLARVVMAGRRTALAERLVTRLRAAWGDGEAARLLPVCSPEFVARLLPELAHAVPSWTQLGRRHPGAVLDHAERELAEQPHHLRDVWWQQHARGVAAAAPARPGRVLALLEAHGPGALPAPLRDKLAVLAEADAERTVRLLVSPERTSRHDPSPRPAVLRRLARADPPSLPVLGRLWARNRPQRFAALLKALPPARRTAFLDTVTEGTDGRIADAVLALLPRDRRYQEARRWVSRGRAESWHWSDVLETLAHCPVEEARPELLAALARPDAEERAFVWPLLVANAGASRDPAAVHDLLGLMQRLRNEQDPVRAAALDALADVRPDLFTADGIGPLDRIVTDALEARDSSPRSRAAVRRLAAALLREHARDGEPALRDWALSALERMARYAGVVDLGPLHRSLPRGGEYRLFDILRPWLEAAAEQGDHRPLFALAAALGDRAHRMEPLQRMLEGVLTTGDDTDFAIAARWWLDAPATRGERVERILALEPSAAVLAPVQRVLTSTRVDLLDVLIADTPPYGRFLRPGTRRPLPATWHAPRWLPRQQAAVARLADEAVADGSRPLHERAAALRAAAALPDHGAALALRYAESPEVALAEAALGALVWTGRPQDALPVLLAHAGSDRARTAVYAAARAARFVPPSELAERLGTLLSGAAGPVKVTSRKEAARLAARYLPPRRAAALLAAAYRAPGQHPDVQAAVVGCSAELLGQEEIRAVLAEATRGAPQVTRALAGAAPWSLPEAHRAHYARLVGEVCRSADPEAAAAALQALPRWAGYAPEAAEVLPATVGNLDERTDGWSNTWRTAAHAVASLAVSGLPHPLGGAAPGSLLHDTAARLLTAVAAGEFEALEDRDLPARQRLLALVDLLPYQPGAGARPVLEALAAQFAGEPSLTAARADLLRRLVTLDADPSELAARLRAVADAVDGRPVLAGRVADRLGSSLAITHAGQDPEPLLAVAQECAAAGGPGAGLLAVGMVHILGTRLDWPAPWRAALRALRRHPVADVRDAALAVFVARE
ncbi:hypothetical protein [Streptomyces sp. NRRL S-118]|uniref:hypothetical protein n=1 Tax=Streptomyces sp. NRRL S-118 TaxID=1463881 RepID=UPI0004C905E7|nr:hypothetical protein [Streptomyces sp. NRRL S-118]